jgi:hypothetical protein
MSLERLLAFKNSADISDIANKLNKAIKRIKTDFLSGSGEWSGAAINGGTITSVAGEVKHQGCVTVSSSTTQNSGYRYIASYSGIVVGGQDDSTVVYKTPANQATITVRICYHDTTGSSAPTDGVYFEILEGVVTGNCANNTAMTATASNYTLSNNTWYRFKAELNADASVATFTVYADDTETVLWTDTVNANIPTTRQTGHGFVATSSGTSAISLGTIDYMDATLMSSRRLV